MSDAARVSRRALLTATAVAAAWGLGGCTSNSPTSASRQHLVGRKTGLPTGVASAGSDDRGRALAALADEQELVAVLTGLMRARRPLGADIEPLVRIQHRHIEVLLDALELEEPPHRTPLPRRPRDGQDPAGVLARSSRAAAEARLEDCLRADSGSLASLMASMSASHHVVASQWAQP